MVSVVQKSQKLPATSQLNQILGERVALCVKCHDLLHVARVLGNVEQHAKRNPPPLMHQAVDQIDLMLSL